jgi:hypothetical protein
MLPKEHLEGFLRELLGPNAKVNEEPYCNGCKRQHLSISFDDDGFGCTIGAHMKTEEDEIRALLSSVTPFVAAKMNK